MRTPRPAKERPRLQIDVDEAISRAVSMAAAKRGISISAWVINRILPHLNEELAIAQAAIREDDEARPSQGEVKESAE